MKFDYRAMSIAILALFFGSNCSSHFPSKEQGMLAKNMYPSKGQSIVYCLEDDPYKWINNFALYRHGYVFTVLVDNMESEISSNYFTVLEFAGNRELRLTFCFRGWPTRKTKDIRFFAEQDHKYYIIAAKVDLLLGVGAFSASTFQPQIIDENDGRRMIDDSAMNLKDIVHVPEQSSIFALQNTQSCSRT